MKLPLEVERELLVKSPARTDPKYGVAPDKREIQEHITRGVVNIDKPSGPTSHEVVAWTKKILDLRIAGHSGTLDPRVTGVLPIMLGDATRAVGALLVAGKEYVCAVRLHRQVSEKKVREVFREFTTTIYQKPPLKSAVRREIRPRKIYYLNILEIEGKDILFKVGCEAGTYIRKLCHDIGEAIGSGANMSDLRRTRSGPFGEDQTLVRLHELKDAYVVWKEEGDETLLRKLILPMEFALKHLPKIYIRDTAVDALCHGADLAAPGVVSLESKIERGNMVAVFTLKGEAVALGIAELSTDEILKAKEGLAVNSSRVLMSPGVYPRGWIAKEKK